MSNVIAFKLEKRSAPRETLPGQQGQILLFTGIRYIREEAEQAVVADTVPEPLPAPIPLADDRLQA